MVDVCFDAGRLAACRSGHAEVADLAEPVVSMFAGLVVEAGILGRVVAAVRFAAGLESARTVASRELTSEIEVRIRQADNTGITAELGNGLVDATQRVATSAAPASAMPGRGQGY